MTRRGPHHPEITWLPHLRIAWGGSLGTSKEIWTNSMKFVYLDQSFIPTDAQIAQMMGSVSASLTAWFDMGPASSFGNAFIGTDAYLDWLKINHVAATGLQTSSNTNRYDISHHPGTDANPVPFYQTFAISLRTLLVRGRGHAGRIFPPLVQPLLDGPSGMCSVGDAQGMAQAFKTTIEGINTQIRSATQVGSLAILSPGNTIKGTLPLGNPIVQVVVDRVPDVQHRRTNRLPRAEGTSYTVAA